MDKSTYMNYWQFRAAGVVFLIIGIFAWFTGDKDLTDIVILIIGVTVFVLTLSVTKKQYKESVSRLTKKV